MFNIDKRSRILFYGFSQFDLVQNRYRDMLENGYQVEGYIDQRAERIREEKQIPCWNLENLPFTDYERKEIVVIILLQNGMLHEEVAIDLAKNGFSKILFLPMLMETESQRRMCVLYNSFLGEDYDQLNDLEEVQLVLKNISKKNLVVQSSGNYKIVFIPWDILFMYQNSLDDVQCNVRYSTIYLELYDFLSGKRKECNQYLCFMNVNSEEQRKRLLEDRRNLYFKFEYENNLCTDFFIRTAANVQWNENGYFNIIDGHHRVEFLIYKGYRCIPVRMSEKDFLIWENKEQLEKIDKIKNLACPIPNPKFLDSKIIYRDVWRCVMDYIQRCIISKSMEKKYFLELDSYDGYFARACQLAGWTISHIGVYCEEQRDRCIQINQLLYQNDIEIFDFKEALLKDMQMLFIDSKLISLDYFEKIISPRECMHVIVEVNAVEHEEYIVLLEKRFKKSVKLIYWCNDNNSGIYGIGEEKWQK